MDFTKLSGRLCVCLILLVGAVAYGLCLGATYYMDDSIVRSAEFLAADGTWTRSTVFGIIPAFIAMVTDQVFPGSSVAQHVWNLLIHLCLAVTVFWGAGIFLKAGKVFATELKRRRAAFFGALVFVCHPMCSEALNYARCTMIQLVALFSLLAAIGTVKFCQRPSWRSGLGTLAVIVLAAYSKDPGVLHAVGNVVIVAAVFANWNIVTRYLRRPIDWTVAIFLWRRSFGSRCTISRCGGSTAV